MGAILDAAEAAWAGAPSRLTRVIEEVAPRTWFYAGFANPQGRSG